MNPTTRRSIPQPPPRTSTTTGTTTTAATATSAGRSPGNDEIAAIDAQLGSWICDRNAANLPERAQARHDIFLALIDPSRELRVPQAMLAQLPAGLAGKFTSFGANVVAVAPSELEVRPNVLADEVGKLIERFCREVSALAYPAKVAPPEVHIAYTRLVEHILNNGALSTGKSKLLSCIALARATQDLADEHPRLRRTLGEQLIKVLLPAAGKMCSEEAEALSLHHDLLTVTRTLIAELPMPMPGSVSGAAELVDRARTAGGSSPVRPTRTSDPQTDARLATIAEIRQRIDGVPPIAAADIQVECRNLGELIANSRESVSAKLVFFDELYEELLEKGNSADSSKEGDLTRACLGRAFSDHLNPLLEAIGDLGPKDLYRNRLLNLSMRWVPYADRVAATSRGTITAAQSPPVSAHPVMLTQDDLESIDRKLGEWLMRAPRDQWASRSSVRTTILIAASQGETTIRVPLAVADLPELAPVHGLTVVERDVVEAESKVAPKDTMAGGLLPSHIPLHGTVRQADSGLASASAQAAKAGEILGRFYDLFNMDGAINSTDAFRKILQTSCKEIIRDIGALGDPQQKLEAFGLLATQLNRSAKDHVELYLVVGEIFHAQLQPAVNVVVPQDNAQAQAQTGIVQSTFHLAERYKSRDAHAPPDEETVLSLISGLSSLHAGPKLTAAQNLKLECTSILKIIDKSRSDSQVQRHRLGLLTVALQAVALDHPEAVHSINANDIAPRLAKLDARLGISVSGQLEFVREILGKSLEHQALVETGLITPAK